MKKRVMLVFEQEIPEKERVLDIEMEKTTTRQITFTPPDGMILTKIITDESVIDMASPRLKPVKLPPPVTNNG